jgi:hypothetical protein
MTMTSVTEDGTSQSKFEFGKDEESHLSFDQPEAKER